MSPEGLPPVFTSEESEQNATRKRELFDLVARGEALLALKSRSQMPTATLILISLSMTTSSDSKTAKISKGITAPEFPGIIPVVVSKTRTGHHHCLVSPVLRQLKNTEPPFVALHGT